MGDRLLRPEEAAEKLALPRGELIARSRGGGIPHVRFGRSYRYSEAALDAWIAEQTAYTRGDGPTSPPRKLGGIDVPRSRPSKAVGSKHHGGLDDRGPADPKGALRIVRAGSEGHAA